MNDKIEAVIICVNYSDFLSITLDRNLPHLDTAVIVTELTDDKTLKLCEKYPDDKVKCITTDAFRFNGAKFNKGLAINVGISCLTHSDWIMNLDADTVLPSNFREVFLSLPPDVEKAYSARRYDVPTPEEWEAINKNPSTLLTKRLYRGIGYGNFLLTNCNSNTYKEIKKKMPVPYPHWCGTNAESDWIYRNYWSDWIYDPPLNDAVDQHEIPNNDRAENPLLLEELPLQVIHLGQTGKNEFQRNTGQFK